MWLALLGFSAVAWGQMSEPGMGTVTGRVICQDTQMPARLAYVMLFQVPAALTAPSRPTDSTDTKAQEAWLKLQQKATHSATFVETQTGINGSFVAANVTPGDYYEMASVPGYMQPRNVLQAAYDAGEDLTKGADGLPIVHVSADHAVNSDIMVRRGAAIEGHVTWDDGGGVSLVDVSVDTKTTDHKPLPPQFGMLSEGFSTDPSAVTRITDDRGHYRISGLVPGDYVVKVVLQTDAHQAVRRGEIAEFYLSAPLVIYAPDAFHKGDAKAVTLTAGEERTDVDITVKLDGMHSVSGRVTSAQDHHGLRHASVKLMDANDKTFQRGATVDGDGEFNITFVPSGNYTMTVLGAYDTISANIDTADANEQKTIRYETVKQQVMVVDGDVTGQNIELKPVKASSADADAESRDPSHAVVEMGH